MLLSERIVCVGIGQCGGNMVMELENLGFNTFYINTSLEDLDTINTSSKNKYHIKNTKGMAKNQQMAKECILKNGMADNICYAINDQYAMADIIILFFSNAGGSGGGMGTLLGENMKDLFPEKTINVVSVLPKILSDDIGLIANAIDSLQHLKNAYKSELITQIHLLSNDAKENIFDINKDFAICFDRFINFDEVNKDGNLDEEEKEKMLLERGMGVILEFSDDDFGNGLVSAVDNSIYANWLKNPSLHAFILNRKQNKDVNKEVIKDALGMPVYTHQTVWDQDSNVIFSVGMEFNDNILVEMKKKAQELLDKKKKIEEESQKTKIEEVEFDTSIITSNITKQQKYIDRENTTPTRRRRGERRVSSVLDKYRNM